MNSPSFTVARKRSPASLQKIGASVLMMGLALSASARDGSTSIKDQTPNTQGRTTSAGERFDMNQMTCAHPTLPMGTWLRVTNLRNRRTAYVRVNDRGPVLDGRIVDLSFAAARAVGLSGLGKVKRNGESGSDSSPGISANTAPGMCARL